MGYPMVVYNTIFISEEWTTSLQCMDKLMCPLDRDFTVHRLHCIIVANKTHRKVISSMLTVRAFFIKNGAVQPLNVIPPRKATYGTRLLFLSTTKED